jgi:hypothetical protein
MAMALIGCRRDTGPRHSGKPVLLEDDRWPLEEIAQPAP